MQRPGADMEQRADEKAPILLLIYSTFYYVTQI